MLLVSLLKKENCYSIKDTTDDNNCAYFPFGRSIVLVLTLVATTVLKILTRREAQFKRDEFDEGMEMTEFVDGDEFDFPGQTAVGDVFLPQGY